MSGIAAEVIAVLPNKIKISVKDLDAFKVGGENLTVGSYLKIADHEDNFLVAIIENFLIELIEDKSGDKRKEYLIEAMPIGFVDSEGVFTRGGKNIAIPPTGAMPATKEEIQKIYDDIEPEKRFCFSKLSQDQTIDVPVDGDRFFNKHLAIVGSTGSGKSHAVAKIIQQATKEKEGQYESLNNSHVIIFDIHGEYKNAFDKVNYIDSSNIKIPYWLFDSEELGDLFIESNEDNSHNQVAQFRYAVTENKKRYNPGLESKKVFFDSALKFKVEEVIRYIKNLNNEVVGRLEGENVPKKADGTLIHDRVEHYFDEDVQFCEQSTAAAKKAGPGPFKGDFERFILRLETTAKNPRLSFLFEDTDSCDLESVLREITAYIEDDQSNVTVIDLSGIPFEVLSVTVSVISRMLFDYGYFSKKSGAENKTPLFVVYEEAHKYVPKSDLVRYRASRSAIERLAKEGRKYGVTLGIVSQRPSEISETIFSQCGNFIAMRLTNPDDQNYVKRLLPDTLGSLIESLPTLNAGEAILIGDSTVVPSLVQINLADPTPESEDIKYLQEWKREWVDVDMKGLSKKWST